jgi:hypothetical protein
MFFLFQIKGFWKHKNNFKNIFWIAKQVAKNKSWEFEWFKGADHLFEIEIDLRLKGRDHAGPSLSMTLFGYGFGCRIYDHRHWDDKNDTWEKYE